MKDLVVTQMNLDDVRTAIVAEQATHRDAIDGCEFPGMRG